MTVTPRLVGLPPVIARGTRLVVLGSFPGVASLQVGQYYAHPRNQFWPLLSQLLGEPLPALPYRECVARLRDRGAGLWDVYASCRREGSLDSASRPPSSTTSPACAAAGRACGRWRTTAARAPAIAATPRSWACRCAQ
jgi:G:T/U-mismatch repair DNA glycosylase